MLDALLSTSHVLFNPCKKLLWLVQRCIYCVAIPHLNGHLQSSGRALLWVHIVIHLGKGLLNSINFSHKTWFCSCVDSFNGLHFIVEKTEVKKLAPSHIVSGRTGLEAEVVGLHPPKVLCTRIRAFF